VWALGLGVSLWLARAIVSALYGVSAASPGAFMGMAVLLTLVGLLASYIPARRTASVNPIVALAP
jgi:ABC-type antimicrobial peptide transport system permease subunit